MLVRWGRGMAKVLLVCPFCQKRLETSEGNVGREGQCPACENVFPVTPQERRGPGIPAVQVGGETLLGALQEFEYREMPVLASALAVAVCLVLLFLASLLPWVGGGRALSNLMPGEQIAFSVVTAACCLCMLVSFLSRKSLVPAVLLATAWGTTALIWTGGILRGVYEAVKAAQDTPLAKEISSRMGLSGNIYIALALGLLTALAGFYFYYQCKDSDTFRRLGAFLMATEVAAVLAGLVIVSLHVSPMIKAATPKLTSTPSAVTPPAAPSK